MSDNKKASESCCPVFDPTPWDHKTHIWTEKKFIKDSIPTFLHIPLPFMIAKVMGAMWKKAADAGGAPEIKDFLVLANDPSPWKCNYYMYVTKDIPGAENVTMTGEYMSKVFDGPYSSIPKWIKEMNYYIAEQGKTIKDLYFYYTTCPKCAKLHGHNYIVAFARTE